MTGIRRQLTLFVSEQKGAIEKVRSQYNPEQYHLIAAHITLCREDEIEPIEQIIENINSIILSQPICIELDHVIRFSEGKGVMIPGKGENISFRKLRKSVLGTGFAKEHHPHITLMHPRNSTCTDEIFEKIKETELPKELFFDTIALIEQNNGGKWSIVKEFKITENGEN